MLGGRGNDVIAAIASRAHDSFDREVVGLARAAGEHDLVRVGADERRDLPARGVDGFLRIPAKCMLLARGVAELPAEIREHGLEHAGIDRSRGVKVEIDRPRHGYLRELRVKAIGAGGSSVGGSADTSCSEQVASAARMRSLMRQRGSRTLHFAY